MPRAVKESSDPGVEFKQAAESVAAANGPAFGTQRYVGRTEEEKVALALVVPFKMGICRNDGDCGFDIVTIDAEDPTATVPTPSFPGSRDRIARSMVLASIALRCVIWMN